MRKLALPLVVSLLVLAVLACSGGTPVPVAPAVPTYPPQPTYTPYPTQVPPTLPLPTQVPQVQAQSYDKAGEYQCGTTDLPAGTTSKRCFDVSANSIGVLYYQNGRLVSITTLFPYSESSEDAGLTAAVQFTYRQASAAGWSMTDFKGLADRMANNYSGTLTEVYGSLTSSVSISPDNDVIVIIGLTSFFGSDTHPTGAESAPSA